MLDDLRCRIRALFRRGDVERELDDELHFHLEHQIRQNMSTGLAPQDASRLARLEFEGIEQVKERCRDERGLNFLNGLLQDLRYSGRMFRRNRLFTLVVVLSVAVGIGITSAIFSIAYAMLIDPFPYRDSSRMAAVTFENQFGNYDGTLPYPVSDFLTLRGSGTLIEDLCGFEITSLTVTQGAAEGVVAVSFSANAFSFFGVPALAGRTFGPGDVAAAAGPPRVVVLSHAFWQRYYGGDIAVTGKTLELNHEKFTIIGIMPPRFTWGNADIFVPLSLGRGGGPSVEVIIRSKPGISLQNVSEELDAVTHRFSRATPELYPPGKFRMRALSLADWRLGSPRRTLLALIVASAFLLLISCANVSILLLARATARRKEMAVRKSLGASASRIIRQLLTESVALSLVGGLVGVGLGSCVLRVILHFMPERALPHEVAVQMNGPVEAATFIICVLSGLLFGLVPALELSWQSLREVMQDSNAGTAGSRQGTRTRSAIVGSEVVLTITLLAGTAMAVRSLIGLYHVRLGYDPRNVSSISTLLPDGHYSTWESRSTLFERILERLKSVPGVQYAAATTDAIPPRTGLRATFGTQGQESISGSAIDVALIGGDYFSALRIPVLRGRVPTDSELRQAAPVAAINQEMARRFWAGGRDPIGALVHIPELSPTDKINLGPPGADSWFRVIGVVDTALNEGLRRHASPSVYLSYKWRLGPYCEFLIRTAGNSGLETHKIREWMAAVGPDQILSSPQTLDQRLDEYERALPLFLSALFSLFGAAALALAGNGIYSVVSYTVARRSHEFGIRMALGARPADVLQLVLGGALRLLTIGAVIGIVAGVAMTRGVARFLTDWNPRDPFPFAAVVIVLVCTGLAAALIPAWRAARIDPSRTLRHD